MKRFVFFFAFLNSCLIVCSQADPAVVCQYGFTFEISMQKNWGYSQPVVLTVTTNSQADAAGLCVNDIIEKINDKPTAGENVETITSWLQNSSDQIQLTISNLKEKHRDRTLTKICRMNNSLSEKDLVGIYTFYSLEDAQTRAFACPFKTTFHPESDLIHYATFGFAEPDPNDRDVRKSMDDAIRKGLEEKGLKFTEKNPDLIVQTHCSLVANPNFLNSPNADKFPVVCRYNVQTKSMEKLPIYYNSLLQANQAKFFLKLNIRLIDNKENKNSVVWECEANELLQSNYSLVDYAEFHIPLMFMQYPYSKSMEAPEYQYARFKYNYTGIHYNIDNLKEVTEVDPSSPAEKAGIQAGDVIEKINGIKFINTPKLADNNYRQFIFKTSFLRDPATQFTNAEGFTRCMYWDATKYAQIRVEFKKPEYSTVFSYLFYFEPYINASPDYNIVSFNILRGKEKKAIDIKPVVVSEERLECR